MEETQNEAPLKKEDVRIEEVGDSYKYNPDYHKFADFLGVDAELRSDHDLAQKIATIYDWGKENLHGNGDRVDVSMAIKNLKSFLGTNLQGEELVKKLYQWVRLDRDRRRIEKEMELLNE